MNLIQIIYIWKMNKRKINIIINIIIKITEKLEKIMKMIKAYLIVIHLLI